MRTYRMAPSPTGFLHLGSAKAYLVNYALAKSNNAKFLLRIEDTNQAKSRFETVESLIKDCKWMGIEYDGGPVIGEKNEYFQSERFPIYQEFAQKLLDAGKAYKAYETPEERQIQIQNQRKKGQSQVYMGDHANLTKEEQENFEKEGRKPIIRLKVEKNQIIKFHDEVYGDMSVNTNDIGDLALMKSDGSPMYIFAVVVDDYLMEVTDIFRGQQHLSSIPKQVLIYQALGIEDKLPKFGHFSDLLNENSPGKLSKRFGAKPISHYRADGYLSEAIFNYIMVISCSFTFSNKDEEIMSREEIYSKISPNKILKTNSKFNSKKLDWMNGQHIRKLSDEELYEKVISWLTNDARELKTFNPDFDDSLVEIFLENKDILKKALPIVKERIIKLSDIFEQLKFLFITPEASQINPEPAKHPKEDFDKIAKKLYNIVYSLSEPWTHSEWEEKVRALASEENWNHGDVFMVLRLLIIGSRFSPPLFESMEILGKDKSLARIKNYLDLL